MLVGVVAVVAAVAVAAFRVRSLRKVAAAAAHSMRHPPNQFHVVDDEVLVTFEVPLPAGGADPILRDLLFYHAVELIRDRKRRGQPLDGLIAVRVFAKLAGTDFEVGTIDLSGPDDLPEMEMPRLLPLGAAPDADPFRKLGESDETQVGAWATPDLDEPAPIGAALHVTAGIAAGLRSLGIEPEQMTVTELGLGLLELVGYTITRREDETYVAVRGGSSTYVSFVSHEAGTHPELSEKAIAKFLVGLSSARTDRGLLITDKFGPYAIYEKERANPRCRFIARERLQAFVDLIATS